MKKIKYQEVATMWIEEHKLYIKQSTYHMYNFILNRHLIAHFGDFEITHINTDAIQEFIALKAKCGHLKTKESLSIKMLKDIIIVLRQSLEYAVKKGYAVDGKFKIKFPKEQIISSKIEVFTDSDMRKLLLVLEKDNSTINMGILIAVYTGIRIGEICSLKWSDINLLEGTININKTIQTLYYLENGRNKLSITTPKSEKSNRIVPINPRVLIKLKQLSKNNDFYLLTGSKKAMNPACYRYYYYKLLANNNVNKKSFHSLRHTFATKCINQGTDYKTVSEMLGHANVATTIDIYQHTNFIKKISCVEQIKF